MSLSRLALPSIGRVLEGQADESVKAVLTDENSNASMISGSQASEVPFPAVVHQPHLMKTVAFRNNDLENEEVELFSLKVGFPDETAVDRDDQILQEGRKENIIEPLDVPQEQAANDWPKINFSRLIVSIRGLFPFRLVEVLLRRAGRELAKYFAQY